jgi:hypothetical protein
MPVAAGQIVAIQVCGQLAADWPSYAAVISDGIWSAQVVRRPTGPARDQLLVALTQPDIPADPTATGTYSCPGQYAEPAIDVTFRSGSSTTRATAVLPRSHRPCGGLHPMVNAALQAIPDSERILVPVQRLLSSDAATAGCPARFSIPFGAEYDHTVVGSPRILLSTDLTVCNFSTASGALGRYGAIDGPLLDDILGAGIAPAQQRCPAAHELAVVPRAPLPPESLYGSFPAEYIVLETGGCRRILSAGRVIGHLSVSQVERIEALAVTAERH